MATMTKKGARSVTQNLDRIATLFQQEWATLGVPEKIAADFAYRCDLLSDRVEKNAGLTKEALSELDVMKEPGFNPEEIGQEKKGPMESETDEPYMKGEFTQQENRELRERIQQGDLGMSTNPEPQSPQGGKQAFERIGRAALGNQLGAACNKLHTAATRISGSNARLASDLFGLAGAILAVQKGVLTGSASARRASRALEAVNLLAFDSPKLAQMIALATKVAEEDDAEDEDEKDAGKKAGEVPPQFLENMKKKEEGGDKDEKKEDKKAGEIPPQFLENVKKKQDESEKKDDSKKDDAKEEKKASHGFNLFA